MTRYGEVEVGVGIGFVAEGEMPPLGVEREEPMTQHSVAQDEAVGFLLGGDFLVVGVREFTEIVEHAAHIHLLARADVYQREIDSGAAAMPRAGADIALVEEYGLVHLGVERCLGQRVAQLLRPADEVVDRRLRAVGVVNLDAIALSVQVFVSASAASRVRIATGAS